MAFNQEIADKVCEELSKGRSLLSISKDDGMPGLTTLRDWEVEHAEHGANSLRARERGCHALAEECVDIADDGERDWEPVKDAEGNIVGIRVDGEHIQRSKLRIDTRMRLIGKWLPKVYGDKVQAEVSGPNGGPLQVEEVRRTIVDPKVSPSGTS